MAIEEDPFGVGQPPRPQPQQQALVPEAAPPPGRFGGLPETEGGSYFSLSPESMQMMWAPQPQAQVQLPQPQLPQVQLPQVPPPQP